MMRLALISAILLALVGSPAGAAELRLIAATALKDALEPLVRAFEGQSGHKVTLVFSGTVATRDRIRQGEMADVVLIGADALDSLIENGLLQREERRNFARTGLGAGQRAGLPVPDVSSSEALQRAILASRSLAFSRGPSGDHVDALLRRLGIADEIARRTQRPNSGAEVARLVGTGEAEFGIAQVSEFMGIPGVTNLGPLPPSLQAWTIYAAAIHVRSSNREGAGTLIDYLSGTASASAIRSIGMEPAP